MNELLHLPHGWARATVGQLGTVRYGKGLAKKQRVETGQVRIFGSAGPIGHHDRALIEEPVIVVGRKGNAGSVWLTQGPSWPIDTTYYLQLSRGLSASFLALQLGSRDLLRMDSSTTIPSLRRPDLEAIALAVAPLAEQRRVVERIDGVFARLDAIEKRMKLLLGKLTVLRSVVLANAFYADRDQPPHWISTTVGEVAEVQLGRQRSPKHHTGKQMRPYLRAANVTWDGISLDDIKEMNFDDSEFERYRLEPGDLLLNEASGTTNEVGKPAIWDGQIEDCCFQNTLLRLRPRELDLAYLYWYCYFSALTGRFGDAGRGVNIRHLGKRGLSRFPIPVAPRSKQSRIADDISNQFDQIRSLQQSVEDAQKQVAVLRRAVLAEAFAGRLVAQDPDDEPASVLLERIAASRPAKPKRRRKARA